MIDEWLTDATRLTTVQALARVEAAARARRLAAMVAVLDARQAAARPVDRERWYLDNWAAVAADGLVTYRAVEVIVWRTAPVADPAALAAVNEAVAEALVTRPPLSEDGLALAVDAFVDALDPGAIETTARGVASRAVTVHYDEAARTAYLSCTLFGHDAWALEQLVDAMAQTACPSTRGRDP